MSATNCSFFQNMTNASILCDDNEPEKEKPNSIIVVALYTICLWIILTNGVVVICFVVSKDIKKNLMNAQILSLSFTDLLVGFSALVLTQNYQNPRSLISYEICLTEFMFYLSAQIASFYHTCCICLHRFIIVFFCLKSSSRRHEGTTIKITMIQVLTVWIVAGTLAFIPFVFGGWGSTLNVCSLNVLLQDRYNLTLTVWNISLLASQIVINIMYISIYLKLRHTWVKVTNIPNSTDLRTSLNTSTRNKESVPKELKELKLDNVTKLSEFKTHNLLKVPQHQPIRQSDSQENSLQQLPLKIMKQEESGLPCGTKDNTILHIRESIPSCSQQTREHDPCHKLNSVDKSSNKGKNLIRQSHGQPADSEEDGTRNNRTKHGKHSKILVTIGLVLLVLDICLTPLNMVFILENLQEGFLSRKTKFLIVTFSLFNSGINPIIYAFRIVELRQSVKNGYHLFKTYFVNSFTAW